MLIEVRKWISSARASIDPIVEVNPAMGTDSYTSTRARFDSQSAAHKYAHRHDNARDRREQRCIAQAMSACGLANNSLVLDLPCGAGRLTPLIVDAGHRLVAADSSPHMVAQAVEVWNRQAGVGEERRNRASFRVDDVMNTGYEVAKFDLVICNRLLHHFTDSSTRVRALAELSRVSRRWVIVSFFNSGTVEAKWKRIFKGMTGQRQTTRLPISLEQFKRDSASAGLRITKCFPTQGIISPQWYMLLERI